MAATHQTNIRGFSSFSNEARIQGFYVKPLNFKIRATVLVRLRYALP